MTAFRTPTEWARLQGVMILDPDGWRTADAPPFDQPISKEEFDMRLADCTVGPADWGQP